MTAEPEQVTDTSNGFRVDVLHPKDLLAILVVVEGCESRLQVVRRYSRRKTTNWSRSGTSDSIGGRIISMPLQHSLESRAGRHKCAAFGRAVVDAPVLRSVQAHDVRRSSAR